MNLGIFARKGGPTHQRTPEYDGFDINMVTYTVNITHMSGHLHKTTTAERDYVSLRPFFLWHSPSTIELTYKNTTQYARCRPQHGPTIRDTAYKSPFPIFNVLRRHEPVATDTIVSKIPAINGYTCAQIFVGGHSHVIDVFPIHSPKEFVKNTLEDLIRKHGAMDKLSEFLGVPGHAFHGTPGAMHFGTWQASWRTLLQLAWCPLCGPQQPQQNYGCG
jgi:hypothetical protein